MVKWQRGPALPQSLRDPGIKRPGLVDFLGANAPRITTNENVSQLALEA